MKTVPDANPSRCRLWFDRDSCQAPSALSAIGGATGAEDVSDAANNHTRSHFLKKW